MLLFERASLFETVGDKLNGGKGLREGRDSKELWKSVEKADAPRMEHLWFAPANCVRLFLRES